MKIEQEPGPVRLPCLVGVKSQLLPRDSGHRDSTSAYLDPGLRSREAGL